MLDGREMGIYITEELLKGKLDGMPVETQEATRKQTEDSMIRMFTAWLDYFKEHVEISSHITGGQTVVAINASEEQTPLGTRGVMTGTANLSTGEVTIDPIIILTPAEGDTCTGSDPAVLQGVVTIK